MKNAAGPLFVALVVALLVLLGALGWLGTREGAAIEPVAPGVDGEPAGSSSRTSRREAREPDEDAREARTADEAFDARMRSRYDDLDDAALEKRYWNLRREVELAVMRQAQPLLAAGEGEPDVGTELPPELLVYRGPGPDGGQQRIVLDEEEFPALYARHAEAVWILRELSRRGAGARDEE